jgi:hypothetical protein
MSAAYNGKPFRKYGKGILFILSPAAGFLYIQQADGNIHLLRIEQCFFP